MTIDFHAHILPGCDHGSSGMSTTSKQLKAARESGVDIICATSHFYPDRENVEDFLARREKCAARLFSHEGEANSPKILLGAEILACVGLERIPGLEKLCLEGTNILLVEMPFNGWQRELVEMMESLSYRKEFRTVLAHADRYDPMDVERILEMGIPIQLNAESLSGLFVKKHIKDWMDRDVVVAIGSDIHGSEDGYKKWDKARSKLKGRWDEIMERTYSLINT